MTERDLETLFRMAVEVWNGALEKHGDSFPYKQILAGCEKVLGERNIGVAVYRDDPNTPHDYFTLRYEQGRLELVSHGKQEPEITWKVKESFLEQVVEHRDEYIEHPEKLDWDWLKSRVGLAD